MDGYLSGTLTFLFTDIEGSTAIWEQCPDGMKQCVARHDSILRQAVESNGGQVVKTTGDGIHAAFSTAVQGVTAALAAQQALITDGWVEIQPRSLRVRMGLHSGEAELRDGDYYGTSLNRAARLMSAGQGGQVLISQATVELVRDTLPAGVTLTALGEHRLKDLSRPEQIYQLVYPGLPAVFPPIKTLDAISNNLPIQTTSFIGRDKEKAEIQALLSANHLVTLMGSGGTGKTRLSLEVASAEMESFPGGVWLADLAPLVDPGQVISTLAQVFGLQEAPFNTLESLVTEYLRSRQVLLILDNCEHLIAACARLADHLLHHCPLLKIIASSREALGISGEVSYRIPSLVKAEAVRLFAERAQATNSDFRLTQTNTAVVEQICHRLDGIPLAIELAAARVRLLTPEQIAARLSDRFRLLIGGSRTALPRQQTLRALIDWSYDLLAEEEKSLLRTAAVFTGGWTLEALETVSQNTDTLELLEQLVNKSLVATEERGSQMRYFLLETIRQYARERLFDAGMGDAAQLRARHLAYFVHLAEDSYPRLLGPEMAASLDELELEQDNLRAAVEWAIETDPISALRIGVLLPSFWSRRLSVTEGYAWISTALARADALPQDEQSTPVYRCSRAWGLLGKAVMAFELGDNNDAMSAVNASIDLARHTDDRDLLAYALALGSTIGGFRGEVNTARTWAQEAQDLARRYTLLYTLANVIGMELFISVLADQPISTGLVEETIQAARASGNPWALGMTLTNIGRVRMREGRWAEAASHFEESAELSRQIQDRYMHNMIRSEMGHLLRAQQRYQEAAAIYRETISAFKDRAQYAAVAHELECLAFMAVAQSQAILAATLLGAAEALREKYKTDMTVVEKREYDVVLIRLHGQMDQSAFDRAWFKGRGLNVDQAIELAIAEPS